jgi:hypothetical protein
MLPYDTYINDTSMLHFYGILLLHLKSEISYLPLHEDLNGAFHVLTPSKYVKTNCLQG